jgi:hypothetical protein
MTTWKTRAVVEGLTQLDMQPDKCTEKGAQKEGTDGVCEDGEECGAEEVRQNMLNCTPTSISRGFARPSLSKVSLATFPVPRRLAQKSL